MAHSLWLAWHLPALSLESWAALLSPAQRDQALVLIAQQRLVAVNPAARALGLQPGMKRATALALAPQLLAGAADAERDAEALRAVAHALLAFSPSVSLVPPDAVLVEVRASLRCFGGPQTLWQRMQQALAPLGLSLQRGHAPTAVGALLLARWRDHPEAPEPPAEQVDLPALARRLAPLPVDLLVTDSPRCQALLAMGLHSLGDLRRQPRAGLSRRFGPDLLTLLDRAHGVAADPRHWLSPPLRFASRLELAQRSDNSEDLLLAASLLLTRLAAWAGARHARVQRFVLHFQHETRLRASSLGEAGPQASQLGIALAEPSADPAHWQAVLRERLAREPLAAPVLAMALDCDEPVLGPPPDAELFPSAAGQREGLLRLLERLQARLGADGVQSLARHADHRPEHATRCAPALKLPRSQAGPAAAARARTATAVPAADPAQAARATRPVWLLAEPQALPERQSRPSLNGQPLQLLAGPERIEAGWWDQGGDSGADGVGLGRGDGAALGGQPASGVARDYFIAQASGGELVWIYRLRPPPAGATPGWFLHGRFA